MADKATPQQRAAIEKRGRVIVSAAAGSGKTFVMIRRLADLIERGGDLDNVLAVTFTKKAAAQMKEKLRSELVKRASAEDDGVRAHIKRQLGKIASANISTIHSFCGYLLRVYFYLLDIDGSFEVVSEDGGAEAKLRSRAADALFDRLYEADDEGLLYLLERYGKKRTDSNLKKLVMLAYDDVRNQPGYTDFLKRTADMCDERSFDEICGEIRQDAAAKCAEMTAEVYGFLQDNPDMPKGYKKIAEELLDILESARTHADIFTPLPKFSTSRKPPKGKAEGAVPEQFEESFSELRDYIKERYAKLYEGLSDRDTELAMYLESGRAAAYFCRLLLAFDEEYAALKREEGKLDYGDLEHLTLKLLGMDGMAEDIRSRFKYVFVDEYQDVNPVQERIISLVGGDELFLVGDVKQAIYGFRGSKSVYFTGKAQEFAVQGGSLVLSHNFRSSPAVIAAVNSAFSRLMRADTCGIDYKKDAVMLSGGGYPEGSGGAYVHIFGGEERQRTEPDGIYSVQEEELKKTPPTREGLAVLDVVRRELESTFYDLETGTVRAVEPGDICILTRKRDNSSAAGIYRALTAAGLPVSGAQGGNVCRSPEVKQIIDILSYIDNGEQDIPLASAMLSPVGGFTEEELARIKIAFRSDRTLTFRGCCERYASTFSDGITKKLAAFYGRVEGYRTLASLYGAGTVIDAVLRDGALEAEYFRDGAKKLKNVRRLAEAAYTPSGELSVNAFLSRLKSGGYNVAMPESGGGDSIKIMTMHSSKGLEFPIVILADVTRPYRGINDGGLPLDEKFGFAHKYFDMQKRVCTPTVLGRLCALKDSREEVKNEMNLLYVACTRAKYRLHVMSREDSSFNPFRVTGARNYAQMLDFSCFKKYEEEPPAFCEQQQSPALISRPDEEAKEAIESRFMRQYAFAESVELPVKSSASAILKMNAEDEYYAENVLFPREGEEARSAGATGAEAGIAYHRFLQLCDFAVKDEGGIRAEIKEFLSKGSMSAEQAEMLDAENLSRILKMPCFDRVSDGECFREREFLCALPACELLGGTSRDEVLVQGAIDLLCVKGGRAVIVDYKYSSKPDGLLADTYRRQLDLYRLAAEKILSVPRENTEAYIVNIYALREIKLY